MLRTSVLVTGATGFLGQRSVLRLLRDGEHVRVLARSATNAKRVVVDVVVRRGIAWYRDMDAHGSSGEAA